MKVFFIIRALRDPSGVERVTTVIANGLAERGYETGIVCLQAGTPFFPLHELVKVHYLPPSPIFRIRNLKKLYAQEHPDIVVFVGSHRLPMNVPAAKGIPSITWEHFNAHINWHPLHAMSRRMAVKHSKRIVTLTEQDRDNYRQMFGATNAVCIPNPITIENIAPTPLTEKRVLAVGRLASQKGFDMLLNAWAKTEERKNGWQLRIVGSGRHLSRLQEQIRKNGIENSVEIVPATKNIVREYQQASIFVMSSRYEGFGLVLLESMAAGLPAVSFDCEAGPREIIDPDKTGILVPNFDIDKLGSALDELMSNEQKRKLFSENALKRRAFFSPENIIDKWEELFKSILIK